MFAVVRTGGKQYRVAPGDKIVVEKMDGNAGDRVSLGDVLLAGDGSDLKSTDGLTVAAEIVAQAKGEKVTVFKKRRRHNYRRKKGHRQQHTILKIIAIGDQKEAGGDAKKAKAKPAPAEAAAAEAKAKPAPAEAAAAEAKAKPAPASKAKAPQTHDAPTANPAPADKGAATGETPARPKKAAAKAKAETPSTQNAAPAKGGSKKGSKSPKAE